MSVYVTAVAPMSMTIVVIFAFAVGANATLFAPLFASPSATAERR